MPRMRICVFRVAGYHAFLPWDSDQIPCNLYSCHALLGLFIESWVSQTVYSRTPQIDR